MSAERCYRALLRAYPPEFRAQYEREMMLTFRQCRRDAVGRATWFWAELLWDVARSAPALRLEAMRARWCVDLHITEGAMTAMGILAALIGVLEVINSLIEGVEGGLHRPGLQLLSVVLGVVGGVVLLVAGIAMLRRGARAIPHAFRMAATCLVAFAFIEVAAPVMSVAAMLLGIVFPLALLVFLFWQRGRGTRVPGVA
jgi:hypothetical protein